jgi:hypothetical protein
MALTRGTYQITWDSGTAYKTATSSTTYYSSDAYTWDNTDIAAALQVNSDLSGTGSASADSTRIWVLPTGGDVLGDTGDDFDTTKYAQFFLGTQWLSVGASANYLAEDPNRRTFSLPYPILAAKGFKVVIYCPAAGTRNVTVRAMVSYLRSA